MSKTPKAVPLSKAEAKAKEIAKTIRGGEILALIGPLGSGKTTFTKALGKELGIKQNIPSPTFVMMQEFPTAKSASNNRKIILYHLDLYRTKSFAEVKGLGITQVWGHPETVTVIEWADKINSHLPKEALVFKFHNDVKS